MQSEPVPLIEVPRVEHLPTPLPRRPDIVATVDYLLTALLSHESGTLYSDFRTDRGRWYVRGWTRQLSGPDELVATSEELGTFRMLLAHFGARFMGGQVYGGYSVLRLLHAGRERGFAIYMANDQWRGHWLKAYCMAGGETK
jgi:hypothetical protein